MKTKLMILAAAVVMLASCKEKFDLPIEKQDRKIVVDATLTNEKKAHTVKVYHSTDYYRSEPMEPVTGAQVTLSDGSSTVTLTEEEPGIYRTAPDYEGVSGRMYTLTIAYEGKTYTASSYMYSALPMDSIAFEKAYQPIDPGVILDPEKSYYNVRIWCQEPGNERNFYTGDVMKNGVMLTDTISKKEVMDDCIVNGSYLDGYRVTQIEAVPGDNVTFILSSICEQYFRFMYSVLQSQAGGSPFAGPPANLPSNFEGGALGFFNVCAVSKLSGTVQ